MFGKRFIIAVGALVLAASSLSGHAADGSRLKLPPGANVALVVFEDLQCPACADVYPVVKEAAKTHDIPLVLHDFPLPKHNWALAGAVYARYFDAKSEELGSLFRTAIYLSQGDIRPSNLREFAEKFAQANNVPLPPDVDPEGKLKQDIQKDYELGQSIHLEHTPTIFVICGLLRGGALVTEYFEVDDHAQLNRIIDDMLKKAGPATAPQKRAATNAHKKAG